MAAGRDLEDRLESVQKAIARIERGGESVEIQGRTVTEADLSSLYLQERRLERLLARKGRGGLKGRQAVPLDG